MVLEKQIITTFLESQFAGIIFGGLITSGFTWFLDYLKNRREIKQDLVKERKKTYMDFIEFLEKISTGKISEYDQNSLTRLNTSMQMYASKNIISKYKYIIEVPKEKDRHPVDVGKIINKIRQELGVEKI